MGRFNRRGEQPVEKLPPVIAGAVWQDAACATRADRPGRGVAGAAGGHFGCATDFDTLSTPKVRK
jgi:hypothetical protein